MLNELRDLARSLTGIPTKNLHAKFRQCRKSSKASKSIWIYVTQGGSVQDISLIPMDFDILRVRKWELDNGSSFPAFNIPQLIELKNQDDKEKAKGIKKKLKNGQRELIGELRALFYGGNNLWNNSDKKKIDKCLNVVTKDILNRLDNVPRPFLSIKELCNRAKLLSSESLYDQLSDIMIKKIVSDASNTEEFFDLIFFYTGKERKGFQVLFELPDWSQQDFSYPATHQEVQNWMNNKFLDYDKQATKPKIVEKDAFGENGTGKQNKFPRVQLPVLGNVILKAMNKESPCQKRYGMIDATSFPVGNKTRMEMKSALEWLSAKERKGKTWCDLTKKINKSSCLFAYPAEMPETPPELAGMIGGGDEGQTDSIEATFSEIAARVTANLKGMTSGKPDAEIRIFVLAKMDKARTKVLINRRYAADQTIDSAESWQDGCKNVPPVKIRQFDPSSGNKPVWSDPLIPFPTEVVWCLNTAWQRQGLHAETVHGFTIDDGLCLLLDKRSESERLSRRAIEIIVKNSKPLLLAVVQANAMGQVFIIRERKYAKQPLILPSILGLLLYKIGFKKGDIMNSPEYLVGRLMSLSDQLHLKYCENIRGGKIPPQLVGNALMATALEEPQKAMAIMSKRILPYQAWAMTLKGEGHDIGLVKYFLKQIGEVSDALKNLDIPSRCSDAEKAQMLLGYLAKNEA